MARRSTLNVSLTPALEKYVAKKVASGSYQSASEVIREGLRALQKHDAAAADLRKKVAEGLHDIEAGRVYDGEEVFAELRTLSSKKKRRRA